MTEKKNDFSHLSAVEIYNLVLLGELKKFPNGFWVDNIDEVVEIIRYLIEEKLKWSDDDIKNKLTKKVLLDNKLNGMLAQMFNYSAYEAINAAYPDKFKPWDIKGFSFNYWNIDTAVSSVKWLIEEKLKWSNKDIKEKLNIKVFLDNRLSGMMTIFNNSPYKAINAAYPNRFKPWELSKTPREYWNIETAIIATKWLIEEKLKWTDDDIKKKLIKKVFKKYKLGGMLQIVFTCSPYRAINAAYPDRFKPNDSKRRRVR